MSSGARMGWRRPRAQSWLLLLLVVLFAVFAVLPVDWLGPWWLRTPLAIGCVVGGIVLARLKETVEQQDVREEALEKSIRTASPGAVPLAGDLPFADLGVHRALVQIPYLHRTYERDLRATLQAGEPVLVVGNSMAGKTRMAAEVVQNDYSDRPMIIPDVPAGLADLVSAGAKPERAVIWLDDLDRYIADPRNLKPRWLRDLISAGNLVVATMREKSYEQFRPTANLPRTQWELLRDFHPLRMGDEDDERQRLAEESGDAKLAAGISRYGLGAYIGGGPLATESLESARNARARAYGLIMAAVDWRRSGIGEVILAETAEALIPAYRTARQIEDDRDDTAAALAWATSWDTGADAFRLLTPTEGGWRAFDYLLDAVSLRGDPIPVATWDAIATADAPVGNLVTAGIAAYDADHLDASARLFRKAADLGDATGMYTLRLLIEQRWDTGDVERYRKVAEAFDANDMCNLGAQFQERGDTDAAEQLYRKAADLGDPTAMCNLGVLLAKPGDTDLIAAALALFAHSPSDVERWAVTLLNAQPNMKQVGDKGIDGVARFALFDGGGGIGRILVSVKGGKTVGPQFVRDLVGTVETQKAELGVLITDAEPTRGVLDAANHAGTYKHPATGETYPKTQVISFAQLLAGYPPRLPGTLRPYVQAQASVDRS